jgi:hypothetical protein
MSYTQVGDPVAWHDRGRVLQPQRLVQGAGGEERTAGAEDDRDLVEDHLVDARGRLPLTATGCNRLAP